jgi:hypothetical protein
MVHQLRPQRHRCRRLTSSSDTAGGCLRWALMRRCVAPKLTRDMAFYCFHRQVVERALELAGGEEEAAIMLLLDGAVDCAQQQQQQQQQQQHSRPLSVRFAKSSAAAALPQTRQRPNSKSPPRPIKSDAAPTEEKSAPSDTAPFTSESTAAAGAASSAACDAPLPSSAASAASAAHAAADHHSPNDWVLLQHPDDHGVVAYGNAVTREFSLQPPEDGSRGSEGARAEGAGSRGC